MTAIRPELSKKNKYWIEKHRYYELKHFCLQYDIFKKAYSSLDGFSKKVEDIEHLNGDHEDPTAQIAIAKENYRKKMFIIEQAALQADPDLACYIIAGVTEDCTYENLKARLDIPCCRDTYYDRYRKFFYILNKLRD